MFVALLRSFSSEYGQTGLGRFERALLLGKTVHLESIFKGGFSVERSDSNLASYLQSNAASFFQIRNLLRGERGFLWLDFVYRLQLLFSRASETHQELVNFCVKSCHHKPSTCCGSTRKFVRFEQNTDPYLNLPLSLIVVSPSCLTILRFYIYLEFPMFYIVSVKTLL